MKGLFSQFMGRRTTTKGDVILAVAGVIMAATKAVDVVKQYKEDHPKKENKK